MVKSNGARPRVRPPSVDRFGLVVKNAHYSKGIQQASVFKMCVANKKFRAMISLDGRGPSRLGDS